MKKTMLTLLTALVLAAASPAWCAIIGQDIGNNPVPSPAGSTIYISAGNYDVEAGGQDVWGTEDSFHYSYDVIKTTGDFEAIVRVESLTWTSVPGPIDPWAKAGIMCRNTLAKNASYISVFRTGQNGARLQARPHNGGNTMARSLDGTYSPNDPVWLKLARKGNAFAAWWAPDAGGIPGIWEGPIMTWAPMSASVYLGFATTSHYNGFSVLAEYRDYSVGLGTPPSLPPIPNFVVPSGTPGGAGYMGVREIINNGKVEDQDVCYSSLNTPAGTIVDYTASVLNIHDSGANGHFSNDNEFEVVNIGHKPLGDVNHLSLSAEGYVRIPHKGVYTFGVNSDDGFTLQFPGQNFIEVWGQMGEIAPFGNGNALRFWGSRVTSDTLGVIYLPDGDHPFVLTYNEGEGDAAVEFFGAVGRFQQFDPRLLPVGYRSVGNVPKPGLNGNVTITVTDTGIGTPILNLTDAETALADGTLHGTNIISNYENFVNHSDPDSYGGSTNVGSIYQDLAFPGQAPGSDDDDFAVKAEGVLDIPQDGKYQIGYNSDDGCSLRIFGQAWTSIVPGSHASATRTGDLLKTDAMTGWSWTAGELSLTAGKYNFELVMFEHEGGAFVELFGRGVTPTGPDPSWHLLVTSGAGSVKDPDGLQLVRKPCPLMLAGDTNGDCEINFRDFGLMATNWLVDCYSNPGDPRCVPIQEISWEDPWEETAIGTPDGDAIYDPETDTWTITGTGADIWGTSDQFYFVHQKMGTEDFQITVTVRSLEGPNPWAKAGIMVRHSLEPDSSYAMIVVTPGNGVAFQSRTECGGVSHSSHGGAAANLKVPITLRLVRTDINKVTGYYYVDGEWEVLGEQFPCKTKEECINWPEVGMIATSHVEGEMCTATFDPILCSSIPLPIPPP